MSTNSKFVRNRLHKLIGKVMPPLETIDLPPPPKRKRNPQRNNKKSALFRDYTIIKLHSQSGRVSRSFSFHCFRDEHLFTFDFPKLPKMSHDND
jgi:hypothetical protein